MDPTALLEATAGIFGWERGVDMVALSQQRQGEKWTSTISILVDLSR